MSEKCYLCGVFLKDENKHKEHIIQNAIGGTLKPDNILCITCGGKLGNDVDAPFVKIFDSISARLNIKKDRGAKNKQLNGMLNGMEVSWNNFKISPKKPFYEYDEKSKNVKIFANLKSAKKFKVQVIKELGEENINEIQIIDDIKNTGPVVFPFDLDNVVFKKGIAKIAVGFATHHNIKRTDLSLAIDLNNQAIVEKQVVIPFFPSSPIDRIIELYRVQLDCEYPYHGLVLFTIPHQNDLTKKVLVCYVELFSTFQHYIVLNESYLGDSIYEMYSQKIFKKEDITFSSRLDPKTIHICLSELNLHPDDIENVPEEKLLEFFEKKYNQKKYNFDYSNHIESMISSIVTIGLMGKSNGKVNLDDDTKIIAENINNFCYKNAERMICYKKNIDLYYEINGEQEIFIPESFKRYYINDNLNVVNYLNESINNLDLMKDYGHMRFYVLMKYINFLELKT